MIRGEVSRHQHAARVLSKHVRKLGNRAVARLAIELPHEPPSTSLDHRDQLKPETAERFGGNIERRDADETRAGTEVKSLGHAHPDAQTIEHPGPGRDGYGRHVTRG